MAQDASSRGGVASPLSTPSFVVRGFVDGRPTVARWAAGELEADPELVRRAQVVVGLGERFEPADGARTVVASLDGDCQAALLTVLRAFSQVTSCQLSRSG